MDEQEVPIYRGVAGVSDVRALALSPWRRTRAAGAFVELDGLVGLQGIFVMEIGGGKATSPEHHLYEEVFYVVEGSGTATVSTADDASPWTFEWGPNSIFRVPMNSRHSLSATQASSALLIAITNAPAALSMYPVGVIFDTPPSPADAGEGHFDPHWRLGKEPLTHRAAFDGALIHDALTAPLPYDGNRGAGHRHVELMLGSSESRGFIAEYPAGRYSKTHAHASGPVLVCLAGTGYTLHWPREVGHTPWLDGREDAVRRVDYRQGGLVSPVPGLGDWFHGHFGTSPSSFRVLALAGRHPERIAGSPGEQVIDTTEDVRTGGATIDYADEDPKIQQLFADATGAMGGQVVMEEELYAHVG